jgi:membrane protease YdiL (CAAX protease family)
VALCFVGAIVNMAILPGPPDAPIDQLFRAPGAAWVLFAFGATLAPFFEELVFRGFLLPALCTAYDWAGEQLQGSPQRPPYEDGSPRWSLPAMIGASFITSLPFALMHGEQTAWSLGPFSLLICVSLVLCWVRLSTRSLAASTLVHAGYNFTLFSFMLIGTGGFKHLDKM